MRIPKLFIAYVLSIWPIIMFFLFMIITGKVCVSYEGFAVDSESNLYLGKDYAIEVLNENGEVLRNIFPFTSRGYKFTVTTDNTIIISTGEYLYTTDLLGNLIDKKTISDYTDDKLNNINSHKFTTSNGTVYVMKNFLLRTYIYRLEESQKVTVYKMPIFDYIVKLSAIMCFVSIIIVVPICIIKWRKMIKNTKNRLYHSNNFGN